MQKDLFTESHYNLRSPADKPRDGERDPSTKFMLGLDKLLITTLLLVVSYVIVFSWGVEKGRSEEKRKGEIAQEKLEIELEQLRRELSAVPAVEPLPVAPEVAPSLASVDAGGVILKALLVPDYVPADAAKKQVELPLESGDVPEVEPRKIGKGRYTIQLVTYKSEQRAEQQVARLNEQGYRAFIIPSGEYYQVCVERLQTKEIARTVKMQLQRETGKYGDAYIRMVSA